MLSHAGISKVSRVLHNSPDAGTLMELASGRHGLLKMPVHCLLAALHQAAQLASSLGSPGDQERLP